MNPQRQQPARRSINADLIFWSVAGAVVAVGSGDLANSWEAPRPVLLIGGLSFCIAGPALHALLARQAVGIRRVARVFAIANLVLTPVLLWAALSDALALSRTGNTILIVAAAVTLGFGFWQLTTSRRAQTSAALQGHAR